MQNKVRGIKYKTDRMLPLCKEYESGVPIKVIAKRENINESTLRYWCRRLSISMGSRRTHFLNESYFSVIDNQNKAYLLGYLMADGCITKTGPSEPRPNRLFVNISNKDKQVLEFMLNEMQADYPIVDYIPSGTYANNPMSKVSITL